MRTRHSIIGIVTALLLVIGIAAPAAADTRDDMISTDETLGRAYEDAIDVFNSSTSTAEDVVQALGDFATQAQQAATDYRGYATSGDAAMSGFSTRLATASDGMATAANDIVAALNAEDQTAYGDSIDALNQASDDYSATADEFNQYLADNPIASGDPMYVLWFVLLIVSILFLLGAIAIFILGRKQQGALAAKTDRKGNTSQATLKGMRWGLLGLAALFVVGAAIPFVQYWIIAHDGGSEYRVFWYPLAIGGVGTIVMAIRYFMAVAKVRREGSAASLAEAVSVSVSVSGQPAAWPGQAAVPSVPAQPVVPGGYVAAPGVPEAPAATVPAPASAPTGVPAVPSPETILNGHPLPPEPPR